MFLDWEPFWKAKAGKPEKKKEMKKKKKLKLDGHLPTLHISNDSKQCVFLLWLIKQCSFISSPRTQKWSTGDTIYSP